MTERSHDTDRRLEARLEPVERIICGADERVNDFVIFEQTHQRAVANGAHIILRRIFGGEKIVRLALGGDGGDSNVSVFAVASQPNHRLSLEVDFEPVRAENFLDDGAHNNFVIRRLNSLVEAPVNFELFADVR